MRFSSLHGLLTFAAVKTCLLPGLRAPRNRANLFHSSKPFSFTTSISYKINHFTSAPAVPRGILEERSTSSLSRIVPSGAPRCPFPEAGHTPRQIACFAKPHVPQVPRPVHRPAEPIGRGLTGRYSLSSCAQAPSQTNPVPFPDTRLTALYNLSSCAHTPYQTNPIPFSDTRPPDSVRQVVDLPAGQTGAPASRSDISKAAERTSFSTNASPRLARVDVPTKNIKVSFRFRYYNTKDTKSLF